MIRGKDTLATAKDSDFKDSPKSPRNLFELDSGKPLPKLCTRNPSAAPLVLLNKIGSDCAAFCQCTANMNHSPNSGNSERWSGTA